MRFLELNCGTSDAGLQRGLEQHLVSVGYSYQSLKAADVAIVLTRGMHRVYHQGNELPFQFDTAFVRGRGIHAHMTSLLVRLLKHQNTKIFGSQSAGEFTHNDGKITQMVDLTLHDLPIPDTFIFSKSISPYLGALVEKEQISFPSVLKKTGSKGSCVWKVGTVDEVQAHLSEAATGELFLLQEFIPNTFDIRALYFNRVFLGAMARKSADGFYNNASLGATVESIVLTPEEHELSLKACAVLQQDFAGVDIVRSERGPLFFEINNRPGYEGFERATHIDVGTALAKIIAASN